MDGKLTPDERLQNLAHNIKEFRKVHGLSLEDLAQIVGTTKSTIHAIENAKRIPSVLLVADIAEEFGMSVNGLLYRQWEARLEATLIWNAAGRDALGGEG